MKVRIKANCIDKHTGKAYAPGMIIEVTEDRGAEMLLASDFVELVEADKPKKSKKKA